MKQKSGNFLVSDEWQPCSFFIYLLTKFVNEVLLESRFTGKGCGGFWVDTYLSLQNG